MWVRDRGMRGQMCNSIVAQWLINTTFLRVICTALTFVLHVNSDA